MAVWVADAGPRGGFNYGQAGLAPGANQPTSRNQENLAKPGCVRGTRVCRCASQPGKLQLYPFTKL